PGAGGAPGRMAGRPGRGPGRPGSFPGEQGPGLDREDAAGVA
ncbi:ABC transporter substrate-binding protein, partial [Azospirillum brasilense]|nr:ABC transporter substrate-binding protein [Azospirillum brasilense]